MTGVETAGAGAYTAAAIAAAGTAAEIAAERRKAQKQREIMNQAFQVTSKKSDEANQAIEDVGQEMSATKRLADMQAQGDQINAQTLADLKSTGAGGDQIATAGDAGNTSADFAQAKATRGGQEADRMTALARETAKIRAPGQMQTREGMRRADAQERAGSIWGSARNALDAYQMDAEGVTAPWYGTAGKLARTAAMAYLGGVA